MAFRRFSFDGVIIQSMIFLFMPDACQERCARQIGEWENGFESTLPANPVQRVFLDVDELIWLYIVCISSDNNLLDSPTFGLLLLPLCLLPFRGLWQLVSKFKAFEFPRVQQKKFFMVVKVFVLSIFVYQVVLLSRKSTPIFPVATTFALSNRLEAAEKTICHISGFRVPSPVVKKVYAFLIFRYKLLQNLKTQTKKMVVAPD